MTGVIYFIRCDGFIKIGHARNIQSRMEELQIGCPHRLNLVATVPGTISQEKQLHHRLSAFHHRGEWFQDTPEVRAAITSELPDVGVRIERCVALQRAIEIIGSVEKLAIALQISRQAVNQWSKTPIRQVLPIESLTGVPRHVLRPDVYPMERETAQ